MTSFFQKARDRAQEAFAPLAPSSASDPNAPPTSFSYTGSLPHTIRSSIAAIDPRYESTRSFHLLSGALKSISIDHQALSRETKSAAKATYAFGQEHIPSSREDGVGDEALVDITDRLAYIMSELADLSSAHVKRVEVARGDFKAIGTAEKELYPKRQKRVQIQKDLAALVPERAKASSAAKAADLEKQLKTLEAEDKKAEESLALLKRRNVRDLYEANFDSLIELGEKVALVARFGKLLTHEIPVSEAPPFPAPQIPRSATEPSWPGAVRTAEIRASVSPALKAYVPQVKLPDLSASGASDTGTLGRADTASFGVSHRAELEDPGSGSDAWRTSMEDSHGLSRIDSTASAQSAVAGSLSPPADGAEITSRLNMSPAAIPSSPTLPRRPSQNNSVGGEGTRHRVPPAPEGALRSPLPADASLPPTPQKAGASSAEETFHDGSAPDEPTVAETGAPIVGSGGPKSGVLERRQSSTTRIPMPPAPPRVAGGSPVSPPASSSSSTPTLSADARARKLEEAEREHAEARDAALRARSEASARLRRDGTVVRRGEPDWNAAVEEDLPAYEETPEHSSSAASTEAVAQAAAPEKS